MVYGFNTKGFSEDIDLKEFVSNNYFKCSFKDLNYEEKRKVLKYLKLNGMER